MEETRRRPLSVISGTDLLDKIPTLLGRGPERSGGIALFQKNRGDANIFHSEILVGTPTEFVSYRIESVYKKVGL
ncbi:hypothetical protein [Leptospira broomii]|uniref:hypothetical protein n=1 Tax=Leptospira broomii TaxID=301541 RepID=UPI00028944BB|nr:hypothetical protein [Leptospira broomii]